LLLISISIIDCKEGMDGCQGLTGNFSPVSQKEGIEYNE
jgi:hypothetical protein